MNVEINTKVKWGDKSPYAFEARIVGSNFSTYAGEVCVLTGEISASSEEVKKKLEKVKSWYKLPRTDAFSAPCVVEIF